MRQPRCYRPAGGVLAVLCFVTLGLVGCRCAGGGVGDPCGTNQDCEPGLFCDPLLGQCAPIGGGTDASPGPDAMNGTDAMMNPTDSGADSGADSGVDAGADAGRDAAIDSGSDAATDSGSDAVVPCVPGDGTCDTGDLCNVGTCIGGSCVYAAPDCGDANGCTDDSCDPAFGCQNVPNTAPCSDSDPCTVGDVCGVGVCQPGSGTLTCTDTNPCTDDICVAGFGCSYPNNTDPCNDGDPCFSGDTCGGGTCNPGSVALFCSDFNACTDDSCVTGVGCQFTNDDTNPCSDEDQCSTGDSCTAGMCNPTGVLDCSGLTDACNVGMCNPGFGCFASPVMDGTGCNDGDSCTLGDSCQSGMCVGSFFMNCDDGNPCTDDGCTGGLCIYVGNSDPCDDGDACTMNDTCAFFTCQPGAPVDCDDGDPFTADICDPATGCSNIPLCFIDDFDGIIFPGPWNLTGDWQLISDPELMSNAAMCVNSPLAHLPAFSGAGVLWFGEPAFGNYRGWDVCTIAPGPTAGFAETPPFLVPAGTSPVLAFYQWFEIECGVPGAYDQMTVFVSVDGMPPTFLWSNNTMLQGCGMIPQTTNAISNGGASYTGGAPSTPNVEGYWQLVILPMTFSTATDRMVQVLFEFDSVDGIANSFRGWALDDVMVACP